MSRFSMLALACVLALSAAPAFAADPAKKVDRTEIILNALAAAYPAREEVNLNEVPLIELLADLGKKFGVTFAINEESFKAAGQPNIKEEKPKVALTALRGLSTHQFLALVLDGMKATYLVKNGTIEIVPIHHAAKIAKVGFSQEEDGRARLNEPLVCALVKEKPLNEVVAKIAETYDLTVVVSPQAGDARTGFVTARLLNVPADKAIELLALQCDLRVVRRGTAFLVTSKDHAAELFNEKLDKERQKIEVEKLRTAPAKPPAPPEKPAEK